MLTRKIKRVLKLLTCTEIVFLLHVGIKVVLDYTDFGGRELDCETYLLRMQ